MTQEELEQKLSTASALALATAKAWPPVPVVVDLEGATVHVTRPPVELPNYVEIRNGVFV